MALLCLMYKKRTMRDQVRPCIGERWPDSFSSLWGRNYVKKYLAAAGALTALAGIGNLAYAADAAPDDSLTWFGVTLYGTVDVGYTYQTRGTPLNDYFPPGLEYMVQKNATKKISSISENGLSQSKVGLRGIQEFYPGFSGIFKLETHFNPLSGNLSDGVKSVVQNNGVFAPKQTTNGDSNRAGQPFGGAAYAGIQSTPWGTLTIGRQNSLLLDNVLKYDPLGGSYAFSFVGYSGTVIGSGDTQDGRLDNSVKYFNQIDKFRIAGMFQNGAGTGSGGNAGEANIGADPIPGLSIDAAYANKRDAILATPASPAQFRTCAPPAITTSCLPSTISADTATNVTVSDNWTWGVNASYVWTAFKFYGSFQDIHFRNPHVPLAVGAPDIGGYTLGWVNNDAYPQGAKIFQYMWSGVKYSYDQHLDITAAWYYILQNQFRHGAGITCPGGNLGATFHENPGCSGREAGYSLVADYKFNRHFDAYAGIMWSHLADGLAAGTAPSAGNPAFNSNIVTIDPTIGGRFNF
jgi:predicted porin